MSSADELNSLARFRKQPEKLVLEEHGHCEVPAGCGGVVLRWRNPFENVPLTLFLSGGCDNCFLDGTEMLTGLVDSAPGRHAFAFVLKDVDLTARLILFAAFQQEAKIGSLAPVLVIEPPLQVLTADDGTWKFTRQEPTDDAWKLPAFDDRDWLCLAGNPTFDDDPDDDPDEEIAHVDKMCIDRGAVWLGLPETAVYEFGKQISWWQRLRGHPRPSSPTGDVWVRKVFDVPAPQLRDP